MALNYQSLAKRPRCFRNLTGMDIKDFQLLRERLTQPWQDLQAKKKSHGRSSHLPTLEDKLLCVLIYYRTYITHTFLGYLFNLHNSNICRLLKTMEPLVAKEVAIKKDRSLTCEKILAILADVTEQPTQRPKYKQRKSYSGKKKGHTIKHEIVMEAQGRIISVSKSYKGRVHDFRIRKQEKPLEREAKKYADSGYQGWQKLGRNVVLPIKRSKKKALSKEAKEHNRALSSFRMKIEHKIREMKIYKILQERYRNFQKKHHMRLNIIAGIVNMRYGF